ncbi:collectin-10-like [Branchiostoma lanceolatum]|uniref:collectin-10-like n=1 Tax=Branchiostoma lanceolatum TaxID=7740 RepID=UPI0034536313
MWRGICYKAFTAHKIFSEAAATCGGEGGTLAMPRDAETNAFLTSLSVSANRRVYCSRIGLRRQHREGTFQWVDGSALGDYTSWGPGQPTGSGHCVYYSTDRNGKWVSWKCDTPCYFMCQVAPARG